MRLLLAIFVGKLIIFLSRTFKIGGGSAAPGLYALKIEPDLVRKLARQIPRHVVITGTNGKTTTARMLLNFAKECGLKVIINHTGSNLERGIASALIDHISLGVYLAHTRGVVASHVGIWELDEAAFNSVAPKFKPDIVVFLNVFRDQLDRYGEVDTVIKNWCETLSRLDPKTIVLVNGDDANTAKLKGCFKGKVETFGVEDYKIEGESLEKSSHHKLDFEAKKIKLNGLDGSNWKLEIRNLKFEINLPIPGIYHIYDAVAAFAAAYHLGFPLPKLLKPLKNFQPAFGRVEKLPFGYIFLIKNPAGATQVFETIAGEIKPQDRLLIALNDNIADGTDVSWIWDADFEALLNPDKHTANQKSQRAATLPLPMWKFTISGSRAADLAVRLKYAGFDPKRLIVQPDLGKALKQARAGLKASPAGRQGQLFILPTYTALLELQKILAKIGIKKHYWEE